MVSLTPVSCDTAEGVPSKALRKIYLYIEKHDYIKNKPIQQNTQK